MHRVFTTSWGGRDRFHPGPTIPHSAGEGRKPDLGGQALWHSLRTIFAAPIGATAGQGRLLPFALRTGLSQHDSRHLQKIEMCPLLKVPANSKLKDGAMAPENDRR